MGKQTPNYIFFAAGPFFQQILDRQKKAVIKTGWIRISGFSIAVCIFHMVFGRNECRI
jgi:hypothetical protein